MKKLASKCPSRPIIFSVLLPLIIIAAALLSAAVVTYGSSPAWGQFAHGLAFIVFARRFEGALIALSLIACIGLLTLVISGRRRAWWLLGLAPVLALFAHRFEPSRVHKFGLAVEDPPFVTAAEATLQPADYVVGLRLGDTWYAYPYAQLFSAPVIVQPGRTERIVLMWSAYANRAVAMRASLEVRAADIDIVSTPANATLIYNGRSGQFINALTGQTIAGRQPSGFGPGIPVVKMRWADWLALHRQSMVMNLPGRRGPSQPIDPIWPMPASAGKDIGQKIALVGMQRPVAIEEEALGPSPMNTIADGQPVMIVRASPAAPARAWIRRVGDLRPLFHLYTAGGDVRFRHGRGNRTSHLTPGMFIDADTGSTWSADGVWMSGPMRFKGDKLAPMPVEDGLDWRIMKYWYPELSLAARPKATPAGLSVASDR